MVNMNGEKKNSQQRRQEKNNDVNMKWKNIKTICTLSKIWNRKFQVPSMKDAIKQEILMYINQ
jgi:hypothetical protein